MKKFFLFALLFTILPSLSSCALLNGRNQSWYSEESERYAQLHQRRIASAVVRQDLVLGMRTHDVRTAWGSPYDVESAGERTSGNERWIYLNGLSSPGFRDMAEKRIVYFERGQVIGWETLR